MAGAPNPEAVDPAGIVDQSGSDAIPNTAAELLARAQDLLDRGHVSPAMIAYREVVESFPETPESDIAARMLRFWAEARASDLGRTSRRRPRLDPRLVFSTRTMERATLSTADKVEFGLNAFAYGVGVGILAAGSLARKTFGPAWFWGRRSGFPWPLPPGR